jgi:hypothetical protein
MTISGRTAIAGGGDDRSPQIRFERSWLAEMTETSCHPDESVLCDVLSEVRVTRQRSGERLCSPH